MDAVHLSVALVAALAVSVAAISVAVVLRAIIDGRKRKEFVQTLSSADLERLRVYERVQGDWREFKNLLDLRGPGYPDKSPRGVRADLPTKKS